MKIRRQVLIERKSIRSIAKKTGLSRNTIKKYVNTSESPKYKRNKIHLPKIGRYTLSLKDAIKEDLTLPRRERRTVKKLYEQIVLQGYTGSYNAVCNYIQKEQSKVSLMPAFVPLKFPPGDAMQFDWSTEFIVLNGKEKKIKVAHFRLCHSRKSFVVAYLKESQMVLDAFVRALNFYQAVPKRVLIDNAKTMVISVGRGKERVFHPRFLALMNHYLIEPVACNPASGWEKGQVENQVGNIRKDFFVPKLRFLSMEELNIYLHSCCINLSNKPHPYFKERSIKECFIEEQAFLQPAMKEFDGYIEHTVRVSSTCLVQYETNRYSVPSKYVGQHISLRIYANKIKVIADEQIIAEHKRCSDRHNHIFEPWHYVSLLAKKPGALRNGAPFEQWQLPSALQQLKDIYLQQSGGDRDFVQLLLLIEQYDMETVVCACELAIDSKAYQLAVIINIINEFNDSNVTTSLSSSDYPYLKHPPLANCKRYEQLVTGVNL